MLKSYGDIEKITQALSLIASSIDRISPFKALKILYLVDRYCFRKFQYFVTDDTYVAMRKGPEPLYAYELIEGSVGVNVDIDDINYFKKFISIENNEIKSIRLDRTVFDKTEIEALEKIISKFINEKDAVLGEMTHKLQDFIKKEAYLEMEHQVIMDRNDMLIEEPYIEEPCYKFRNDYERALAYETCGFEDNKN